MFRTHSIRIFVHSYRIHAPDPNAVASAVGAAAAAATATAAACMM